MFAELTDASGLRLSTVLDPCGRRGRAFAFELASVTTGFISPGSQIRVLSLLFFFGTTPTEKQRGPQNQLRGLLPGGNALGYEMCAFFLKDACERLAM